MNKQELINYVLGANMTAELYIAALFFVIIGLVIKWYIQVKKGVKTNENTPDYFSWKYFLKQNLFAKLFSLFANICIAFVSLRFCQEIFNIPLSMFVALCMGLFFDFIIDKIKGLQNKLDVPK